METILFLTLAYLIGSIPFGLIVTYFFGLGDIRNIGSGNIGATNVLRTGNKFAALLTLILDGAKGAAFILVLNALEKYNPFMDSETELYISGDLFIGLFVILGHCFPIWLKFKGGKGVATALGILLVTVPFSGIAACVTWLITAKITKISSLSALVAFTIALIVTTVIYGPLPAFAYTLITALIFLRHKDNIKRIRSGTEPKIGQKKNDAPAT